MPLPIPFYLRDNQTIPLTHTQLDGNFTILNSKIDNTTCNNIGNGVGIFESKETTANSGTINLYSLSGVNGVSIGVSGTTLVVDGSGINDSDWLSNGDAIYNANTGNVGIGTPVPKTKLELYSTGNTVTINNILRFADNDTVVSPFQEQFIGKIEFHSNENSGNSGVKSYIGGVQNSAAGSSIIFATTGGTNGTLEGANPQDLVGERMRIDPDGNVGIGIGVIAPGVPVVSAKLHVNNTTTAPSFLVEDSTHPDSTPFIISSGGSVSIGTDIIRPGFKLLISGDTLSEGDIYLPDNHKLRIGDSSDLQIYHDGLNTYIAEVGTGQLLLSGTELHLEDALTGKPFLRGNSAASNVKLYWSGDSRITTSEDGLVLDKTISGTPIANLSVRADGTIITGSTVPEGLSTTVISNADPDIPYGINTVFYTTTSPGGTIYIGDSSVLPSGYQVKLIRTSTTAAATLGAGGTSTINGSVTKPLPTDIYSVTTCIANGNVWYCSTDTVL
tara:strand:- start:5573 stop:7075 length:1503 start_codon:yes stop_codon:yes gene_type:complete